MEGCGCPQRSGFAGRMMVVGFGCVGRGVLPLLLRHVVANAGQITVLAPPECDTSLAASLGVRVERQKLTRDNHASLLGSLLQPGDFLLNLSVDVGSADLIAWCQPRGVLYLDACTEPWAGGYADASLTPEQRTNHALRSRVLELRRERPGGPTAVLTHGVNPGLVSHFVKQALLNLAADLAPGRAEPTNREEWATLACDLGIRAIHIAERDTQAAFVRRQRGEFVNTWSVEGLANEACQPAELGWGSHERSLPANAHRIERPDGAVVWLESPGGATKVRSWTPLGGAYEGFLITHSESLSIADYLTLHDGGRVVYRPTVHYAYRPCDDTVASLDELAGRNGQLQPRKRVLGPDDIVSGMDELGVLLLGHARSAYWYGSRLTIEEARTLCPGNTATSLQTAAGVLAGVVWAIGHPEQGIVEPDEMPFREILDVATPYLGEMAGVYGDGAASSGWCLPNEEKPADKGDPWQFSSMLVRPVCVQDD